MTTSTISTNPCPVPTITMTTTQRIRQELAAQLALIAAAGEDGISPADTLALVQDHWLERLITLATWIIQALLTIGAGCLWLHEQIRRHHLTAKLRQEAAIRLELAWEQLQLRWPTIQQQARSAAAAAHQRWTLMLLHAGITSAEEPLEPQLLSSQSSNDA